MVWRLGNMQVCKSVHNTSTHTNTFPYVPPGCLTVECSPKDLYCNLSFSWQMQNNLGWTLNYCLTLIWECLGIWCVLLALMTATLKLSWTIPDDHVLQDNLRWLKNHPELLWKQEHLKVCSGSQMISVRNLSIFLISEK